MPSNDCFGLHDEECFFPAQLGLRQEQPKVPIRPAKFRVPQLPIQYGKVLTKGKIF